MAEESFDYIVIGSGSAGGVVAARLSEDPSVSVLLLEAGPEDDDDMIHLPVGFATLFKTKWDWGYQTTPQKYLGGRRAEWPGRGPAVPLREPRMSRRVSRAGGRGGRQRGSRGPCGRPVPAGRSGT